MNFVKLTENNDHEGETWVFWLQLENNEDQLTRLSKIIDLSNEAGFDEEYEIDLNNKLSESEVDTLVNHCGQGYMSYHNKVTGRLELPDFDDSLFEYEHEISDGVFEWLECLYKGGIRELYKNE